jgi:hypothetical protein
LLAITVGHPVSYKKKPVVSKRLLVSDDPGPASNLGLQITVSCWAKPSVLPRTSLKKLHAYQFFDKKSVMLICVWRLKLIGGYSGIPYLQMWL